MESLFSVFIILALIVVIIIQAVDKLFTVKQHQAEMAKMLAAIMARTPQDYANNLVADKKDPITQAEPEDIELSTASDDVFDKFIERQVA